MSLRARGSLQSDIGDCVASLTALLAGVEVSVGGLGVDVALLTGVAVPVGVAALGVFVGSAVAVAGSSAGASSVSATSSGGVVEPQAVKLKIETTKISFMMKYSFINISPSFKEALL